MGGYLLKALVLIVIVVLSTAVFRNYFADESPQEVATVNTGSIVRTSVSVPNTQRLQQPAQHFEQGDAPPENSPHDVDAYKTRLQQLELWLGQTQDAYEARFQALEQQLVMGTSAAENSPQTGDVTDARVERLEQSLIQIIDAYETRFEQLEQQLQQATAPIQDRLQKVEQQLVQTSKQSLEQLQNLKKAQLRTTSRLDELSTPTVAMTKKKYTTNATRAATLEASPAAQPDGPVASTRKIEPPARVAQSPALPATKTDVLRQSGKEKVSSITAHKTGDWVVNLASYTRKTTAARYLASFQDQGVAAEMVSARVRGKTIYRVRVAGFDSLRAAKAQAPAIEQQLGLKESWFSRH